MDAVVVSVGIDKFGVDISIPLIIIVQTSHYFARNHHQSWLVARNAVPLDIKIELEGVANLLTIKSCQNVAELRFPEISKFINNDFGNVILNNGTINISSIDKPCVGLGKIWNMRNRFFKFGLERHILADCYSTRVVSVAIAPLHKLVVLVWSCRKSDSRALAVRAAARNRAVLIIVGCKADIVGAIGEIALDNVVVDADVHILERECATVVTFLFLRPKIYSYADVVSTLLTDCAAPRNVSPLTVIHIVSCILDAVEVSFGIDKFGVDISISFIIIVQISRYFACNHHQSCLVARNAVPLDIKIELEGVAYSLAIKPSHNVAEL